MTIVIANNSPRVSYTVAADATQTSFAVSFEFFADADLNFIVDGTTKTLTTHYTVSGGDGSTGTITTTAGNTVTGISGGSTVVVTRDIALERVTDFPAQGSFQIASLNTELDRFTAIAADLNDKANRAIQTTDYDTAVSVTLPLVADRKGKVLAFNASTGAVEAGPSTSDVQTVSANAASVALLGTSDAVADMNTLATAAIVADMNLLGTSAVVADMDLLATSAVIADMALLSTSAVVEDMGFLGTSANVTAMGVLGTAAIVEDMGILSASAVVADMALLATTDVIADMALLATTDAIADMAILATSDIVADLAILATTDIVADMAILATTDIVSDLNTLATTAIVADLAILATTDIVNDMNILATSDIVTDLNVLATSAIVTDLNILATTDVVADLAILATTAIVADLAILATTDIVTDLNLLATSAIVADLNLLATSAVIADMASLAGDGANPNITSVTASGQIAAASLDISGNIDVDGITNLDVVDIDGAVDMASTLVIGSAGGSWNGAANGRDVTIHGGSETTTGVGQISVQATDAFGANLGGGISFGGEYSAGSNIDWATLWGRKENATDDNTAGYMQFNTRTNGGNMTERMRIDASGSVAIGTTAPIAKLDVNSGDIAISSTQASDNGDLGEFQFWNITNAGSGSGTSFVNDVAAIQGQMEGTGNNSGGSLHFYTKTDGGAKTQQMNITGAGNVGIGTTTNSLFNAVGGSTKLAVTGSSASTNIVGNTDASISIINTDTTANNTAGLHFARADTDDNPNYAGASIVAQFLDTQATGQYPRGQLAFLTSTTANAAPSEKVRITDTGFVGIGLTAPTVPLHVAITTNTAAIFTTNVTSQNADIVKVIATGGSTSANIKMSITDGSGAQAKIRLGGNNDISLLNTSSDTTRLTIDGANGRFIQNGTGAIGGAFYSHAWNSASGPQMGLNSTDASGNAHNYFVFQREGTERGSISVSGSATAYNTSSDYRMKENVDYTWDATARLKQLKPARFNFIDDASNTLVDGFLAHEVSSIVPEAIIGTKDAVADIGTSTDSNGVETTNIKEIHAVSGDTWVKTGTRPVYQGIDQSKLVPLLIKTIQELEARITALEG